jgi:hypothetical protein
MTDHAARFKGGKLKQPDFDAIRQRVRDFEEENEG